MGFLLIFLSTIFRSLFLPASALPQISSESAFSLRYSANLCVSALTQVCPEEDDVLGPVSRRREMLDNLGGVRGSHAKDAKAAKAFSSFASLATLA